MWLTATVMRRWPNTGCASGLCPIQSMVRMAISQNFLNRRLVVVEVEGRSNGPGLHRVRYLIAVRIYQTEKMPGFNIFSLC